MANTQTINTRLVQRCDTSDKWKLVETTATLMPGEIGVETDTGLFKIGLAPKEDGSFYTWAELEYANDIPDIDLTSVTNAVQVVDGTVDDLTAGKVVGDMGIVRTPLYEGSTDYSYTAYVWNGSIWTAMDGNYSAANVVLSSKIELAGDYGKDSQGHKITTIGNKKIGDSFAAGTTMQSLLMDILTKRIQPGTSTQPAISWSTKPGGTYEVGATVTPTYGASLSAGSYTYGPATGITAKTWEATIADTGESAKSTASGSFGEITITDGMSGYAKVTVKATYDGSTVKPVDNLGTEATDAENLRIKAGSKSATSGGYTGYRKWFCGWKNGTNALADPTKITSDQVRALTGANGSWSGSMNVSQLKQMFFLAPAGKGYKPTVKDASTTAPQTVLGPVTVYVKGENNYMTEAEKTTGGMAYDMWYVNNASAASGSATLNITKE